MAYRIKVERTHRGKDKKKRTMSPKSLANLRPPAQKGEPSRNTTGTNTPKRLYTDEYEVTGNSVVPEYVRLIFNTKIHLQLRAILNAARANQFPPAVIKALEQEMKQEAIPKGMIWAKANSLRLHISAVLEGEVSATTEIRESLEGRATQRIEFPNTNSRLQQLLDAFAGARENPPAAPAPNSEVTP